jgi:hypothetical protein
MRPLSSLRPLLTGVMALLLALAGQQWLHTGLAGEGAAALAAAAVIFGGLVWRGKLLELADPPQPTAAQPQQGRRRVAVGLLLAGAAVLALRSAQLVYANELNTDNRLAWSLHGLSVAALLAAGFLAARPIRGVRVARPRQMLPALRHFVAVHGTFLLFLTGSMGIALFFRLWRFGDLPFGIWYDEAEHGLQALRILTAPEHRPVFEGAITGPAHYLYLVSLAFHWFGVSVQSVRLPSVLFGLLAVPAGYLVGKELLGKPAGLLLALLLAVSSWAVTFSRFGMYAPMSTPLFTLLVVGLLLMAQRTGAWLHFLLTGLAIGYGLCFYTSFRLFGGVLALFFLHTLFVQVAGRRVDRHFWLAGVPLIVLGVLVAVAPLAAFATRIFSGRVSPTPSSLGKAGWPIRGRRSGKMSAATSSCSTGREIPTGGTISPALRCSTS